MTKNYYFTEKMSIETVNARMGKDINLRLCEVMASLVTHLHGFIKDVELTQSEWQVAIDFLTDTGLMCDDQRQEFVLLSDTLGASMLVDAIQHRRPERATENTVFGPFHVEGAPELKMGANISLDGKGEPCLYEGRVLDLNGNPVEGVRIDVWSDNNEGFYDVQQPSKQPTWNNRGVFITGADGRYWFTGIKPVPYPIPNDGPVGKMLESLGRHPWRPAHMHFMLNHPNFERIVTHTFVSGDPYLMSDTVFGVKDSLLVDYIPSKNRKTKWQAKFDFIMVYERD
ncbi:dioxygenase [Oceanisphaera pacifica]|uniref:6-chlorohydroxyquinol-1,2-dioxygenase n=1 Tax=Oceanisphaera pacifica TaxID=2818389 RepID=A0ABS3NIU1_9GAMM|nr:dioxygenase [Oceanisphaera pacifica]MBO1520497.1 hypothetical protein [Oceanisphaera pacifica]